MQTLCKNDTFLPQLSSLNDHNFLEPLVALEKPFLFSQRSLARHGSGDVTPNTSLFWHFTTQTGTGATPNQHKMPQDEKFTNVDLSNKYDASDHSQYWTRHPKKCSIYISKILMFVACRMMLKTQKEILMIQYYLNHGLTIYKQQQQHIYKLMVWLIIVDLQNNKI